MELTNTSALVMGLGVHGGGLGVTRFLVEQGARVTVTDLATPEALQTSLAALDGLPVRFVLGEHRDEDFRSHAIVVQNPGVPRESRYLTIARAAGAAIETEMTLFFRHCPNPANILGITGTKGKTTTTLLAGAMLAQQYPDTVVAGNLRVSALEQLPRIRQSTPVVLELSSWQLEGLGEARVSPRFACVTNLSPDHLNRYGSMADYALAKQQILLHQDRDGVVILNRDDPLVSGFAAAAPGEVVWFAEHASDAALTGQRAALWYDEGLAWQSWEGEAERLDHELLCQPGDVRLLGQHNRSNVAAAAALARCYGVEPANIRRAIQGFRGVPHRLEPVREHDGVRYVNDTTATAPAAALAALAAIDGPLVLIAGGADKQLPFEAFAQGVVARADALVLLAGSATPRLQAALNAACAAVPRQLTIAGPYDDFATAIQEARRLAAGRGTVLLAPGCASFGMFRNEFHRGDEFRRIVQELE